MLVHRFGVFAAATCSFICVAPTLQAQVSQDRLAKIQHEINLIEHGALSKLSPQLQKALSGGAQNMLQAAKRFDQIQKTLGESGTQDKLAQLKASLAGRAASSSLSVSGPTSVNDPSTDLFFSTLEGMTQSETSTAWCGSGVVVGFNDSGSFLETLLFGPGGLSFGGAGASTNGGSSFTDIGFINPGPNPATFLGGDPVVNCTSASTFYYSQIAMSEDFTTVTPISGVTVSQSTDGGFTWADPVFAVAKNGFSEAIDKDWSAIDPKNVNNIYVSYTDFDFTGSSLPPPPGVACPGTVRIAIEIVHSTDGGATWSAPTVVAQVCSNGLNFLQGSQIAVNSHGSVYVSWEQFPQGNFPGRGRLFRIAHSTDHATTFTGYSTISTAIGTGDGFALEGNFRAGLPGSLAVDRSGTKTDGYLYFLWDDGRYATRFDLEAADGVYDFSNIVLSRSTNGGTTWSAPVRVNSDPVFSVDGIGIDHFMGGIAVNGTGELAACWYDRRDDPLNFRIGRFCGTSTDQGRTWSNAKVDPRTWSPTRFIDAVINPFYLGDYDTVTADNTKASLAFQGAYGPVNGATGQNVSLIHVH